MKKTTSKEIIMQALIKLAEHNKSNQKRFNEITATTSYMGEMWNDKQIENELKAVFIHDCPPGQKWSNALGKCVDDPL
jgi:hypothetical protein